MKRTLILCAALTIGSAALAQTDTTSKDVIVVEAVLYNGEYIPYSALQSVTVTCVMTETQKKRMAEYTKLRNAVYVTYPYARTAGVLLNDINSKSEGMSKKQRKAYVRSRESELRREFTKPITKMSTFQGKVLMKLINRETGNSCYEIIKDYKGGFMATTYQSVAFFFNTSLKQSYESTGNDIVMERLVKEVQRLYGYPEIAKR
jgi:hypothetical protein